MDPLLGDGAAFPAARLRIELGFVRELSHLVGRGGDVQAVLDRIVQRTSVLLDADECCVKLRSADGQDLQSTIALTLEPGVRASTVPWPPVLGQSVLGYLLTSGTDLVTPDLRTDPRFPGFRDMPLSVRALLAVPLRVDGQITGVLAVSNRAPGRRWSREEARLLTLVAGHASNLLELTRLRGAGAGPRTAAPAAVPVPPAPPAPPPPAPRPAPAGWFRSLLRFVLTVFHSRYSRARWLALGLVALFEIFEIRRLVQHGTGDPLGFAFGLVVLVLLLGYQLAEAWQARRETEEVRQFWEWLLPDVPPVLPRLEVAFAHRASAHAAGDYYNVFTRHVSAPAGDPDVVFVVMADVSRLGVQGVQMLATFQACLRGLADAGTPLLQMATQLNRWAWNRSLWGRHFTMGLFVDLDPATGRLEYLSAGHQPPFLLRAGGGVERLALGGLPLGVMPDAAYQVGALALEPGDAFVAVSDGVVQAQDRAREPFGEARLLEVLRAASRADAHLLLQRLEGALRAFTGAARQTDDASFVVLRRQP